MPKRIPIVDICSLCGESATLQESHIVPKFLIREAGLLGSKFKIVCYTNPSNTETNRQDGIKEYLLCLKCERRLGEWESYARQAIYGRNSPFHNIQNGLIIWTGLDYSRMKLFIVSVLWRMSISKHGFYSGVKLGDKHETCMREMLLNNNPREPWRYGCTIAYLYYGGEPLKGGIFSQPKRFNSGNKGSSYRFILSRFAVDMDVSSHPLPSKVQRTQLQLDGHWPVAVMEALAIPWVKEEIDLFRAHGEHFA